jgi:hypothetical protein
MDGEIDEQRSRAGSAGHRRGIAADRAVSSMSPIRGRSMSRSLRRSGEPYPSVTVARDVS